MASLDVIYVRKNGTLSIESILISRDGGKIAVDVSASPINNNKNDFLGVVLNFRDITERKKDRETLIRSENRHRLLFETTVEGILIAEVESKKLRMANPAICRMLGYSAEELLALQVHDIHPQESIDYVISEFNAMAGGEKIFAHAVPCLCKDGKIIYANISTKSLTIDGVTCNLGFFSDITDHMASEQALKESEERYRKLYESSGDAIFTMKEDMFIDCNQRTLEMFGCTREQIINQPPYTFSPRVQPDGSSSKKKALKIIKEAYKGKPISFEWQHIRYDGTPFDAEVILTAIEISSGQYLYATVRDVTERKKTEAALAESEIKFKELANSLPQIIFEADITGRLTFANQQAFSIFGFTAEDFENGITVFDLIIPEERKKAVSNTQKVLNQIVPDGIEYTVQNKDGSRFPVSSYTSPIIEHDVPVGLRGILVDISDEITRRKSLLENEAFYRQVIENSSGIPFQFIFGEKFGTGHYQFIGKEITTVLGITPEEFTEERFNRMIQAVQPMLPEIPVDPEKCRKAMINGKIKSYNADILLKLEDGTEKWLNDSSLPLKDENSSKIIGAFGILQDITDRKLAEEALKQSEKQYRTLIDHSNDAIYLLYKDRFIIVNDRFTEIFGYTLTDLNSPDFNFNDLISPESIPVIDERRKRSAAGLPIDPVYEFTAITKTGNPVQCETSVTYVDFDDGVATQGIIRNISERKQTEEKIKASLQEKEVLLKEIHHRVKNNLQIIASLLNLQSRQIDDTAMKIIFDDVKNRVHTMALIHEGLYRSGNFEKINFSDYLGNLTRHLYQAYHSAGHRIDIKMNIKDIHLEIEEAIPCGLIVNELITNALKHAFTNLEADNVITISLKAKKDLLALTVTDNGVGLPEGIDIRTAESLGLRLVHILAEDQLKGELELKRKNGTAVTILFKRKNK